MKSTMRAVWPIVYESRTHRHTDILGTCCRALLKKYQMRTVVHLNLYSKIFYSPYVVENIK